MGWHFLLIHRPYEYCLQTSGSGVTIDKTWNWTANSTYEEQRIFGGQIVNVWTYEVNILVVSPFMSVDSDCL